MPASASVTGRISTLLAGLILGMSGCTRDEPQGGSGKAAGISTDPGVLVQHGPFSVRMPLQPQRTEWVIDVEEGEVPFTMYEVDQKTRAHVFAVAEYPSATIQRVGVEKALVGGQDGTVAAHNDTLLTSRRLDVHGMPAIEFTYKGTRPDNKTGAGRPIVGFDRLVLVENTVLTLTVNGLDGQIDQATANAFWNTLSIAKTP